MSTPFHRELRRLPLTVRKETAEGRIYFRGQSKLVSAGYPLKPSIGRYTKLEPSRCSSATKRSAKFSASSPIIC